MTKLIHYLCGQDRRASISGSHACWAGNSVSTEPPVGGWPMNHLAGGSRVREVKELRVVDPREEEQRRRKVSGMQPASAHRVQWNRAQGRRSGRAQV